MDKWRALFFIGSSSEYQNIKRHSSKEFNSLRYSWFGELCDAALGCHVCSHLLLENKPQAILEVINENLYLGGFNKLLNKYGKVC